MAKTRVASSKNQKAEESKPWSTALRILTRRDYSEAELRQRLTEKGFEQEPINDAIQRCIDLKYLDDARYAKNRATSLMRQGRAVGNRILVDLRQRGVKEETAQQALAEAREACNEDQVLASLLEKRFSDFNYNSAPAKERRRVVHFLQRRGFSLGRIMELITRKGLEASDEDR